MPTYEYKCEDCNHVQSRDMPMSKMKKTTKCEKCGGKAKKIFSRTAGIVEDGTDFFSKDGKY